MANNNASNFLISFPEPLPRRRCLTIELTRRREFNQASPDQSSCETRSPDISGLVSNEVLGGVASSHLSRELQVAHRVAGVGTPLMSSHTPSGISNASIGKYMS